MWRRKLAKAAARRPPPGTERKSPSSPTEGMFASSVMGDFFPSVRAGLTQSPAHPVQTGSIGALHERAPTFTAAIRGTAFTVATTTRRRPYGADNSSLRSGAPSDLLGKQSALEQPNRRRTGQDDQHRRENEEDKRERQLHRRLGGLFLGGLLAGNPQ